MMTTERVPTGLHFELDAHVVRSHVEIRDGKEVTVIDGTFGSQGIITEPLRGIN